MSQATWIRCFNPLPPSKRGETLGVAVDVVACKVSIRSPRRNEGRPPNRCTATRRGWFQSAPPVETRGDIIRKRKGIGNRGFNPLPPSKRGETPDIFAETYEPACFNPLPPSKRGETVTLRDSSEIGEVSIRSPRRNEGRPLACIWRRRPLLVSIRSPRRNEGRQPTSCRTMPPTSFQSAPPVETRGDQVV